jgi:hypothetical protein
MSVSDALPGVVDEPVQTMESTPTANEFRLEPRCRIYRTDQVRTKARSRPAWDDRGSSRSLFTDSPS